MSRRRRRSSGSLIWLGLFAGIVYALFISRRQATQTPVTPQPSEGPLAICSFNIQVLGTSKLAKPPVVDVLARVIRRFALVAIQEVRSTDDTVLPRLVAAVNANGGNYQFVIGPRLGRTVSKEQYAFVYDAGQLELDPASVYTADDPLDLLHREPLVARFRSRAAGGGEPFTFTLVNIHTDPDETAQELAALANVFLQVQQNGSGEDDVVLLGDLNADEAHLGPLARLPEVAWAISGLATNTRRTASYDNLIFNRLATAEYTGRSGVLDLMAEFGLSEPAALEVSDHLPVWAEFSRHEVGP